MNWEVRYNANQHSIGSEQFVYWNGREPRRCCSPDVFVKLGTPDSTFDSWKTWERGTPELVVEIVSPADRERWSWDQKFERFHELGAREIVKFDPDAPEGARLRVWDRIDDDLVERVVEADTSACLTLGLWWVTRPAEGRAASLRLARDPGGEDLLPAPAEASLRRVAELEAELARRGG